MSTSVPSASAASIILRTSRLVDMPAAQNRRMVSIAGSFPSWTDLCVRDSL